MTYEKVEIEHSNNLRRWLLRSYTLAIFFRNHYELMLLSRILLIKKDDQNFAEKLWI